MLEIRGSDFGQLPEILEFLKMDAPLKIVALVPMKHDSVRVPRKNYRPLLNRPLFHWILTSLSKGAALSVRQLGQGLPSPLATNPNFTLAPSPYLCLIQFR